MGKKENILKKSELNLLKYSSYLKNTESEEFCTFLYSDKKIDTGDLNVNIEEKILKHKIEWIAISSNEWQLRKENPIIKNPSENSKDWVECSLCSTRNKYEFYIQNKYNQTVINIGGQCKDKVVTGEINELAKFVRTEEAGNKYSKLSKENVDITEIIFRYREIISRAEYEVPTPLEANLNRVVKHARAALKKYLQNVNPIVEEKFRKKLLELLEEYNSAKDEIERYTHRAENDKWYLSKAMKKTFIGQESSTEIIKDIKDNGGKLSKGIVKRIKTEEFLECYIKNEFNLMEKGLDLIIEKCHYGRLTLCYSKGFGSLYRFIVNSDNFLESFGLNILGGKMIARQDFVKFFIEHAGDIACEDSSTKYTLMNLVEYSIAKNRDLALVDLHDWFAKKLKDWELKKFESITNEWRLYQSKKTRELCLISKDKMIIEHGIILLFQEEKVHERTINSLLRKAEKTSRKKLNSKIQEKIHA